MKIKRVFSVVASLLIIVSVFSVSAMATNYDSTAVYNFIIPNGTGFRHVQPCYKSDTTPFYVYITASANPFVKTQAHGYGGFTTNIHSGTNVTWSEGEIVPYVICWRGTEYWVHQYVIENGYTYASVGFSAAYAYDEINFYWSESSTTRYTSAIY